MSRRQQIQLLAFSGKVAESLLKFQRNKVQKEVGMSSRNKESPITSKRLKPPIRPQLNIQFEGFEHWSMTDKIPQMYKMVRCVQWSPLSCKSSINI